MLEERNLVPVSRFESHYLYIIDVANVVNFVGAVRMDT
jgi:hypothetical protein